MRKMFFKVYPSKEEMKGACCIERPEVVTDDYIKSAFEDGIIAGIMPVLIPVWMSEEEYASLEEFDGY